MRELTHGSLFSGIGGFELGAKQAGIETLWNCELIEFNRKILKQHFTHTHTHADIRELQKPKPVDIISGGFPCQDISIANPNAKGITGPRSGLWSEMFRIIDEVRPSYVVIENSPELLKKGFEKILSPLSEIGYDAEWQCLSGTTFGIQQGRERVYCIAYSSIYRLQRQSQKAIFQQSILQREFRGVHPGWRTRRDLPSPRTYRSLNDIPNLSHRIKGLGNAVMPVLSKYLFECIKEFDNENM